MVIASGCATVSKPNKKIKPKDIPALKPVVFSAINGDVKTSMILLDKIKTTELSELEKGIAEKYRSRFSSSYAQDSPKTYVQRIIEVFHNYWHKGLLKQFEQEEGLKWVFTKLTPLAEERGFKPGEFSEDEFERMAKFFMDELKKDGYYSNIGGVKPFLNIMVWKREYEKTYNVDLGVTSQEVKVLFMDDFLELGWGAYATFDIMYVGGWAKKDKLFCVKPAYDIESEKFQVSYLGHEARHFADYKLFPKLEQIDLEYRAKLTEVLLADETFSEVMDKFIHEQKADKKNPHAYSAYLAMNGLATRMKVKNENTVLAGLDKTEVKSEVKAMIEEHSSLLNKKGADTVKTVF